MTDRKWPDPKGTITGETGGSHLAHWPPPTMGQQLTRKVVKRSKGGEPVRHATRRGWRLTRAMFSEFEGGEE